MDAGGDLALLQVVSTSDGAVNVGWWWQPIQVRGLLTGGLQGGGLVAPEASLVAAHLLLGISNRWRLCGQDTGGSTGGWAPPDGAVPLVMPPVPWEERRGRCTAGAGSGGSCCRWWFTGWSAAASCEQRQAHAPPATAQQQLPACQSAGIGGCGVSSEDCQTASWRSSCAAGAVHGFAATLLQRPLDACSQAPASFLPPGALLAGPAMQLGPLGLI